MKITTIQTSNFLGARAVDVKLTKPVALFAGRNFAGKSSIQEAVRMALTGESVRVSLKKDYAALITEGQDAGYVTVEWDGGEASVVLPKGERHLAGNQISGALPYVLDAQRFAGLTDNDRRAFLFGLMGLRTDGDAVTQRMLARKCDAKKIEQIAPFLRAGFEAGQKEAAGKAREAKASWKTTTGGESYGSVKAASFRVEKPEVDSGKLEQAKADLATIENEIEAETARLGGLQSRARQVAEQAGKLADLREKAGRFARVQDKLNKDEVELKNWEQKVADTRTKAGAVTVNPKAPGEFLLRGLASVTDDFLGVARAFPDPFDDELINRAETHLSEFKKLHGWPHKTKAADPEAVANLSEYENALRLMQSAVANGKRDLAAANAAAGALHELEEVAAAETVSDEDIATLKARIDALKHSRVNQQAGIRMLEETARQAKDADEKTRRAAAFHQDVQAWEAIGDALAPDGIPGEMLAEALGPINERLAMSSNSSEWLRINIGRDMSIFAAEEGAHPRAYALLSESEKWRADAMIAEAVAHLSGIRLLVLDRFDVLDLKGREDLLYWLDDLAADGEIDTALIFGTLKGLPAQLPESVTGFWIENGVAGKMKEAA